MIDRKNEDRLQEDADQKAERLEEETRQDEEDRAQALLVEQERLAAEADASQNMDIDNDNVDEYDGMEIARDDEYRKLADQIEQDQNRDDSLRLDDERTEAFQVQMDRENADRLVDEQKAELAKDDEPAVEKIALKTNPQSVDQKVNAPARQSMESADLDEQGNEIDWAARSENNPNKFYDITGKEVTLKQMDDIMKSRGYVLKEMQDTSAQAARAVEDKKYETLAQEVAIEQPKQEVKAEAKTDGAAKGYDYQGAFSSWVKEEKAKSPQQKQQEKDAHLEAGR